MRAYRNIYMLSDADHIDTLMQGESLASTNKEYRRVVRDVAQAQSQAEEIDTLLKWKAYLTTDHRSAEYINHDMKPTQSIVYTWKQEQTDKPYAGSLTDEGDVAPFYNKAYGQTMHDLYMEVLQLVAYAFYHIAPIPSREPVVIPVSACDASDYWKYQRATTGDDDEEQGV